MGKLWWLFNKKKPGVLVQSVHLVRMAYPPLKNGNGFAMPNTSPLFNVSPHSRKDFPSSILAITGASVNLCLSSEQLSNWILLPSEIKKSKLPAYFKPTYLACNKKGKKGTNLLKPFFSPVFHSHRDGELFGCMCCL